MSLPAAFVKVRYTPQVVVIGVETFGRLAHGPNNFRMFKLGSNRTDERIFLTNQQTKPSRAAWSASDLRVRVPIPSPLQNRRGVAEAPSEFFPANHTNPSLCNLIATQAGPGS
jgi:hypothetical protein